MNLPLGLGDFSDDGAMALTKDIVKSGGWDMKASSMPVAREASKGQA